MREIARLRPQALSPGPLFAVSKVEGVSGFENDGAQPFQKPWIGSVTKRSDAAGWLGLPVMSASAKDCWSFAREFEEKALN